MTITSGIEPGDKAPDFKLKNANPLIYGDIVSFSESMGENGLIVMFTCNHCPYVVGSESRIEKISLKAKNNALGFVGINSNDPINYTTDHYGMSNALLCTTYARALRSSGSMSVPGRASSSACMAASRRGSTFALRFPARYSAANTCQAVLQHL